MAFKDDLHLQIVRRGDQIADWFQSLHRDLEIPFYTSYDIRDAGYKVAPVDANLFPAGFNNICATDKENAPDLAREYIVRHYGGRVEKVLILTEEHTKNAYYWDNVKAIADILKNAGRKVWIAIPSPLEAPLKLTSASGAEVTVHSAKRVGSGVQVDGHSMDLIICNNDFSASYEEWVTGLETPMNPSYMMGWFRRRKDQFFTQYNQVATQFAELLDLDPWFLTVKTELFDQFDINNPESRDQLATQVEKFREQLSTEAAAHGVRGEPFIFVKNNAGTYGLGVTQVRSGDEVRGWSYKARKKMKATKGGGDIEQVIIQEGIPTTVSESGMTAEPALYMLGCQLAGGFLRVHGEKGPDESLNSPGAVFRRLCVTDLKINVEGCPLENAYGWVAKLSLIAVAREAQSLGVHLKDYKPLGSCV